MSIAGLAGVEVEAEAPVRVAEGLEFQEFFHAEYQGLVRALYLLTADLGEAEDLSQETMARVYERWDRVRTMESPGGYMYRVAVNLNRQRLRHLAVRARRLIAMRVRSDVELPPETRTEIDDAIASLSRGQRQAFMLVQWLGMTAEQAGRILRIAPASVRSRVHRARAALRDRLDDHGDDRG
jgi:RNA polymerase sigma-70 factor, ECF subfamily